jgi:hypothetical protein
MWGGVSPSLCSPLAAGVTESAGLLPHQETTEGAESKGQKTNSAELFSELPLLPCSLLGHLRLNLRNYHHKHSRSLIRTLHLERVSTMDTSRTEDNAASERSV